MGSAAEDDPCILQQQIAVRLQDLQEEMNCSFDQKQGQFALANNWFVKEKKKNLNNGIFSLRKKCNLSLHAINSCIIVAYK